LFLAQVVKQDTLLFSGYEHFLELELVVLSNGNTIMALISPMESTLPYILERESDMTSSLGMFGSIKKLAKRSSRKPARGHARWKSSVSTPQPVNSRSSRPGKKLCFSCLLDFDVEFRFGWSHYVFSRKSTDVARRSTPSVCGGR
jgi:hypothetical protein